MDNAPDMVSPRAIRISGSDVKDLDDAVQLHHALETRDDFQRSNYRARTFRDNGFERKDSKTIGGKLVLTERQYLKTPKNLDIYAL